MLQGYTIDVDDSRNMNVMPLYSRLLNYYIPGSQDYLKDKEEKLQLAMANLVRNESYFLRGPQTLEHQIIGCETREEALENSRLLLNKKMVEFLVAQELTDQPPPITQGTTNYVSFLVKEKNLQSQTDIIQLQSFVKETIQKLTKHSENTLKQLACGYILGPQELDEHMEFLEKSIREAVKETWDDTHKEQFDETGCYDIFIKDAVRERPYLKKVRFSPEEYSNTIASNLYKERLTELFPEKSMAAVAGICMSQTILPEISSMIMNVGPLTLNPFITDKDEISSTFMTIVSTTIKEEPRTMLSHNEDSILISRNIGIALKNLTNGQMNDVGEVSIILKINKDQFPLALGTEPTIQLVDMQVDRKKTFIEN